MKKGFSNVGDIKLLGILSSLSSAILLLMNIDTLCNSIGVILILLAIVFFCVSHNVSKRLYKQCVDDIIRNKYIYSRNKMNTIAVANMYHEINKNTVHEEWRELE